MSLMWSSVRQLMQQLTRHGPARPAPGYTAEEVRRLLRDSGSGDPERRGRVLATAAIPALWLAHLDAEQANRLGRLSARLPTVVSLYATGTPRELMRRQVGTWAAWTIETALAAACQCIAAELNQHQA